MVSFFITLILELFKWAIQPVKRSLIEGAGPGALEERLRAKLKGDGWT